MEHNVDAQAWEHFWCGPEAIWQAILYHTASHRYLQMVRDFRRTQPDAVASLRRDFRAALAPYCLAGAYPRHYLRAGSHLERFYRTVRIRLRPVCGLHSAPGLTRIIAQQVSRFHSGYVATI